MARTTQDPRLDRRTRAAREEGREGRDALLAAALRVFARRGYRQAGVDARAAGAGCAEAALAWHFSGAAELRVARLVERGGGPMRELAAQLGPAPRERDMSVEATSEFARQLSEQREALLLEREYWSLAI